mmetsp:Transcript_3581/g.7862  ORF Transcript_3581/g.7862 Transcript_3581/m.7862 type:complete len:173 (+) Transcript_3581:59-577(+)
MLSGDDAVHCLRPEVEASMSKLQFFACSMVWLLVDNMWARLVPSSLLSGHHQLSIAMQESVLNGELHCVLLCILVVTTILIAGAPAKANVMIVAWTVCATMIFVCWQYQLYAALIDSPTIFGASETICFMLFVWTWAVILDTWHYVCTLARPPMKGYSIVGRRIAADPLLPS